MKTTASLPSYLGQSLSAQMHIPSREMPFTLIIKPQKVRGIEIEYEAVILEGLSRLESLRSSSEETNQEFEARIHQRLIDLTAEYKNLN